MRESCKYGSVRGGASNGGRYRNISKGLHIALVGGVSSIFLWVSAPAQEGYYGIGHDGMKAFTRSLNEMTAALAAT
jgi:hypothetical protein